MLAQSPPPPSPAIMAPSPESHLSLVTGAANPEWLHVGIDDQEGHWGYGLTIGTLVIATDVSGSLDYFLYRDGNGPYVSAECHMIQLARVSSETPQDWNPMFSAGIGYRLHFGQTLINIGLGIPPVPIPNAYQPLVLTNAQALPHVLLEFGYTL